MKKYHRSKYIIISIIVFLIFNTILCLFFSWREMRIKELDLSQTLQSSSNDNFQYWFDKKEIQKNTDTSCQIVLQGWVLCHGQASSNIAIHVLLTDTNTGQTYQLPTAIVNRPDVTEEMADGVNYDYSGFSVNVSSPNSVINESTQYQISFLYQFADTECIVSTDEYLFLEEEI